MMRREKRGSRNAMFCGRTDALVRLLRAIGGHHQRRHDRGASSVRDSGIGISAEDQARIFNRFERAGSVKSFGGLGLCLYITRQIVGSHGGTLRVESEPGAGSTFIVELPLDAP